jgi:hypothetical protein
MIFSEIAFSDKSGGKPKLRIGKDERFVFVELGTKRRLH